MLTPEKFNYLVQHPVLATPDDIGNLELLWQENTQSSYFAAVLYYLYTIHQPEKAVSFKEDLGVFLPEADIEANIKSLTVAPKDIIPEVTVPPVVEERIEEVKETKEEKEETVEKPQPTPLPTTSIPAAKALSGFGSFLKKSPKPVIEPTEELTTPEPPKEEPVSVESELDYSLPEVHEESIEEVIEEAAESNSEVFTQEPPALETDEFISDTYAQSESDEEEELEQPIPEVHQESIEEIAESDAEPSTEIFIQEPPALETEEFISDTYAQSESGEEDELSTLPVEPETEPVSVEPLPQETLASLEDVFNPGNEDIDDHNPQDFFAEEVEPVLPLDIDTEELQEVELNSELEYVEETFAEESTETTQPTVEEENSQETATVEPLQEELESTPENNPTFSIDDVFAGELALDHEPVLDHELAGQPDYNPKEELAKEIAETQPLAITEDEEKEHKKKKEKKDKKKKAKKSKKQEAEELYQEELNKLIEAEIGSGYSLDEEEAPATEKQEQKPTPQPQSVEPKPTRFSAWLKQSKPNKKDEKKQKKKTEFTILTDAPKKKQEFFNPLEIGRKSLEDNENIVTETLARVYADQGLMEKAKSTYEKLALLFPEKSTYFARLIKNLDEENKNDS